MAVAYQLLIIVPVLPPGALGARRNRMIGDERCSMYTIGDVIECLAAPTCEEFRLSVRSMIVRAQDLPRDDLPFVEAFMHQFSNVKSITLEDVNSSMFIRLEGISCTTFNMQRTTAPCRLSLGERVTHVKVDENVEITSIPPQLVRLDFTMHDDHVVSVDTSLREVTARSLVPRVLSVPQHTSQAIQYQVAPQVTLRYYGDLPLTMVTVGGDDSSSEEEPPRARSRLRLIVPHRVRRFEVSEGGEGGESAVVGTPVARVAFFVRPMLPTIFVAAVEGTVCSACLFSIPVGVNGVKAYPCAHLICEGCSAHRGEESMRRCPLCASSHFCTPVRR